MTDLRDVLDSAAGDAATPPPDTVDADLHRGRRALAHRRWGRVGATAVAASLIAVSAVAAPGILGSDEPDGVVAVPGSGAEDPANPGVDLVAFDGGPAPKPISPGLIPKGWTVSGNEYALVISPPDVTTSPDDFEGKLVVLVDSAVPEPLPREVEVAVGDRTGYAIRADDSALQVWVPRSDGTALRAQAPARLHWDEATVGRFLGAVHASDAAVASNG